MIKIIAFLFTCLIFSINNRFVVKLDIVETTILVRDMSSSLRNSSSSTSPYLQLILLLDSFWIISGL